MKLKFIFSLCSQLFILSSFAQSSIIDNFETLNKWSGELEKFKISDQKLQLNDVNTTGIAYIVTSSEISLNASWEFWAKMNFAPSASNKLEIILMSDSENISQDFNGYYLSIGENGSSDALEFYKKSNGVNTKLARGIEARFANQLDSFKLKITRDAEFRWTVYSNIGLGYEKEFEIIDTTFLSSKYFGFKPIYTSTRNTSFYFDQLRISGEIFKDTLKPQILSSTIINSKTLKIIFSEAIDSNSIDLGKITFSTKKPFQFKLNNNALELYFKEDFTEGNLALIIDGIRDLSNNSITKTEKKITNYTLKKFDLVISEVLFNPFPDKYDYIEIYNSSPFPISCDSLNLCSIHKETGVIISKKSFAKNLTLKPHEYYVFTENTSSLLASFPSLKQDNLIQMSIPSMNNDEGTIALFFKENLLIDQIYYSEKFHASYINDNEGVALERIILQNPALDNQNWYSASEASGFGTPTQKNSVNQSNTNNSFSLSSSRISPDGDGFEDFCMLHFQDVPLGTLLNLYVFDKNGVLIEEIFKNYSISGTGDVIIKGERGEDLVLHPGIYILLLESYDTLGNYFSKKLSLTVCKRL